jgi:hypothetical protein
MATSKKARNPPARPSALVHAQHREAPVKLSAEEHALLDEGLARARSFARKTQDELASFGAWLLGSVFGGDAREALDDKSKNPVWMSMLDRAGGPTLPVTRNVLYMALKIAAYDQRIPAQSWQGLDAARKTLLFPLVDDGRIRSAAKHVADFNLTQAATKEYVTSLLGEDGKSRQVRLTPSGLVSRVKKLRESLDGAGVVRRVAALGHGMAPGDRKEVAAEIARLRDILDRLSKAIRG